MDLHHHRVVADHDRITLVRGVGAWLGLPSIWACALLDVESTREAGCGGENEEPGDAEVHPDRIQTKYQVKNWAG